MRVLRSSITSLAAVAMAACSHPGGSASCGIAALTGPLAIKESFAAGHALAAAPDTLPPILPVRLIAGPVMHGAVSRSTPGHWAVVTRDAVGAGAQPGFGVLVLDANEAARGVLVFDGPAVMGAPQLGTVAIGDTTVPLLGVRFDLTTIEKPGCPTFPEPGK